MCKVDIVEGSWFSTTSPKFPGIVVGSLGRINALIDHGHLRMNQVKLIVLDECDQLVDSERDHRLV